MSRLLKFNYYFCQFLFFRIARGVKDGQTLSWGILFVLPITGWNSDFIPRNPKYIRVFWTKAGKEARQ